MKKMHADRDAGHVSHDQPAGLTTLGPAQFGLLFAIVAAIVLLAGIVLWPW